MTAPEHRLGPAELVGRFFRPLLRPGWPPAVHPLLFGAYAVLFLYSQNLGEARPDDVAPVLARVLLGVGAALVVATLLLRDMRRAALVVTAATIAFFAFGHVQTIIEPWQVPEASQVAGWLALIAVALLVALLGRRLLEPATTALDSIGVVLLAIALIQIVPTELGRVSAGGTARAASPTSAPSVTIGGSAGPGRDIYYLVFDRYGSEDSLQAGFGIDNDLPEWLTEHGFYVATKSHANYSRTTLSLAGTWNLDYWNPALVAEVGRLNTDYGPVDEMLQEHTVARFLKERGYRYYHLGSWWGATKRLRIADENLVWEKAPPEFDTVFYETTAGPTIERWVEPPTEIPGGEKTHRNAALYELRTLKDLVDEPGPKLVTAHILLPHEPYVFDEQGRYHPKPGRLAKPESERYAAQMRFTNSHIRELVSMMLALPESKRPIVVIQADEGPYPPRFVDPKLPWSEAIVPELEMKFGIFNAWYTPGLTPEEAGLYPTISSVNTFRLLFDDYFDADLPLLPDRSFVSRLITTPYDLIEVTDQLPTLHGGPAPAPSSVIPGPGRDGRPLSEGTTKATPAAPE